MFTAVMGEAFFAVALVWLAYTGAAEKIIMWLFSFQF